MSEDMSELADAIAWAEDLIQNAALLMGEGTHLRTLIAAASAQVPREPTRAMINAGTSSVLSDHGRNLRDDLDAAWRAMYDAAPKVMTATPCPDGDACPDARKYGHVHPTPHAADDALVQRIDDYLQDGVKFSDGANDLLQRASDRIAALEKRRHAMGMRKDLKHDPPTVLATLGFWPDCQCGECYAIHCLGNALTSIAAQDAELARLREALRQIEAMFHDGSQAKEVARAALAKVMKS